MRRATALAMGLALGSLPVASLVAASPDRMVHELRWFVHVDLLAPRGRSLNDLERMVAQRSQEADLLLEGLQGPADTGCCTTLEPVSVEPFGRSGDGLDVITSDGELDTLAARAPGAYLVRSVFCCGCGSSPDTSILGCADTPGDFLVLSLDAEDEGLFAATLAHERGHNAGLSHVAATSCELMAPVAGGSCLAPSECRSYRAKANARLGICGCLGDAVEAPGHPDGTDCSETSGCGLCSGGVCGACGSPAEERLVSAGGTDASDRSRTREALIHSGLTGGWGALGSAAAGAEVTGLAYASRRGVLYGIEDGGVEGDDRLIALDPGSGRKLAEVAPLAGQGGLAALAYDPGSERGDDRLLTVQVDAELSGTPVACVGDAACVSTLLEIDPDDGSIRVLGDLDPARLIVARGVTGLAFDPGTQQLFGASVAGIHRIVLPCEPTACRVELVSPILRRPSSLAYDPLRQSVLRIGSSFGETRLDSFSPGSGIRASSTGLAPFTPGGLAAVPVPEPGCVAILAWAAGLVALMRRPARRHGFVRRV